MNQKIKIIIFTVFFSLIALVMFVFLSLLSTPLVYLRFMNLVELPIWMEYLYIFQMVCFTAFGGFMGLYCAHSGIKNTIIYICSCDCYGDVEEVS